MVGPIALDEPAFVAASTAPLLEAVHRLLAEAA